MIHVVDEGALNPDMKLFWEGQEKGRPAKSPKG